MFDLKSFRKDKKITQEAIQEILDCSQSYVSAIESGRKAITDDNLQKIKAVYKDEILPYFSDKVILSPKKNGIPFYDVDVTLGNIDLFNDQTIVPAYFIDAPAFYGCDLAVPAFGNSMHPDIKSGSIVGVKEVPVHHILPGEAYFVITTSYRTIKYVRTVKGDDSKLRLVPKNIEEFDEAIIDKRDIIKIYLVKAAIMNRIS